MILGEISNLGVQRNLHLLTIVWPAADHRASSYPPCRHKEGCRFNHVHWPGTGRLGQSAAQRGDGRIAFRVELTTKNYTVCINILLTAQLQAGAQSLVRCTTRPRRPVGPRRRASIPHPTQTRVGDSVQKCILVHFGARQPADSKPTCLLGCTGAGVLGLGQQGSLCEDCSRRATAARARYNEQAQGH